MNIPTYQRVTDTGVTTRYVAAFGHGLVHVIETKHRPGRFRRHRLIIPLATWKAWLSTASLVPHKE